MDEKILEIMKITGDLCGKFGMNTSHDYDGVESIDDIILYLKSMEKELPSKGLCNNYISDKPKT